MTDAYPLAWPDGWARTKRPERSRFNVSFDKARQELEWEIQRMGGRYVVISTNVPLRRDGRPYASQGHRPDHGDAGVAVYFERDGKQMVFACDRWDYVQDNMRAIQKTIDAMRGIERWGASDMMERAFSAFQALPPPKHWRDILAMPKDMPATRENIVSAYRMLAAVRHPDRGGSTEAMAELNAARDAALKEVS